MIFPFKKYFVEVFVISPPPKQVPEDKSNLCSMSPTLHRKDKVLVRKCKLKDVIRGNVVAFNSPTDLYAPYLGRVVAFEGELVEIKNESVYINNEKLTGIPFESKRYTSIGEYAVDGNSFIVPKASFFVLGDNSENSYDSRFYGAVSETCFIGKGYKIYRPLSRAGKIK